MKPVSCTDLAMLPRFEISARSVKGSYTCPMPYQISPVVWNWPEHLRHNKIFPHDRIWILLQRRNRLLLYFWVLGISKVRIIFWSYLFDGNKSINHIQILLEFLDIMIDDIDEASNLAFSIANQSGLLDTNTWDMGDYLPRKYFDYICKNSLIKV